MRNALTLLLVATVNLSMAQEPWTLERCIAWAEEKHLDVINASLDADLADKNLERAYWDLAPSLNAVGTHGYNFGRVVDRFTNTFATDRVRTNNFFLSADVDLFRGLSKQNSIGQAGIDSDAAIQSLEAARVQVRISVVQAFLDILGIQERIIAAEKQAENTREQIALTTALVDGGRVARAELLAFEAQLAQEEFTVTDWNNQLDQRTLALGRALQLEPNEIRELRIVAPELDATDILEPSASMEQILANVLETNPSYAQMELQVRSAEMDVEISRAGHLPTLSLSGSVGTGYSGRDFRQVGDPIIGDPIPIGATEDGEVVFTPNINYATEVTPFGDQLDQNFNQSVGLTLSVPIFNNMRNSYAVQQARVQYEKSQNRLISWRNDLQQEVLGAMVQQRSAYRQYIAATKAMESGELSLEYAQERFSQGVITSLELNTAKTNLNRSQADLINAKYQYLVAIKYLDILQGRPVTL